MERYGGGNHARDYLAGVSQASLPPLSVASKIFRQSKKAGRGELTMSFHSLGCVHAAFFYQAVKRHA